MNYKTKLLVAGIVIFILAVASLLYIKNAGSKKAEIRVNDQQVQIGGSTSDAPKDTSRSNLDKPSITDAKSNGLEIQDKLVDFGFKPASGRIIDTIVIHSTYNAMGGDPYSVDGVIAEYKSYGVSPHYLIDRDGNIYRLVEDKNIAYHAGISRVPDGRTNVNDFSLGIELIEKDTDHPTDAQYASLNALLAQLKGEYKIKYVLGHDQIAPGRKTDPWNFDWNRIR